MIPLYKERKSKLFNQSVQQRIENGLEQENFVQEDFKIKKTRDILTLIYEDHSDFTFSIDSEKTKLIDSESLLDTKETGFKITKCPGEHKNIEIGYSTIGFMRHEIRDWLKYIKLELEAQRKIDREQRNDWDEKKEDFTQKVDNYFEHKVEKTNKFLSNEEIGTVESTIDYWKDQVETVLEQTHIKISTLESQVERMQKQLDSLKNDANFKTKTDYAKSVFKKIGIFILTNPTATEKIFEVMNTLLAPLGYQEFLQSDWAKTLESTGELPSAINHDEEH